MKLINKMLLAVGLLALSSVGFATTVSPSSINGSSGTIVLDNTGPATIFLGSGTGSFFYDLTTTFDTNSFAVATSTLATATPPEQPITISLYEDVVDLSGNTGLFDAADTLITTALASISAFLSVDKLYFIQFDTTATSGVSASISAVPVPAAGILFASALFGAGFLGRRKKKTTKSNMIGAFARAA